MRSDEMGEFLATAAHGLYTYASSLPVRLWISSLPVLYLKPTMISNITARWL
jgi:hypothetical protein